ncbi:hypothetical protein [Streptomyces sp. XD-27]|uniref:hypothetical protein n=1 Tax=Streptomyces sp. XD-27 TaxID=3062779 RepID=UPI0026F434DC|nr:hypothetical protein [Streptomyces sp. XD-27]WKX70962.1 hypothetical protein Q3Y56_14535 [Streptomyces sp. XD-27]
MASLAALLTAASLALTACGGDSKSDGKDKIDGAKNTPTAAAPTTTAPGDGIKRPEIKLPGDVKNVFEPKQTGDPKQDAVLADNERAINSIDEAITKGKGDHLGLKFYSKGSALVEATRYIQSFYAADTTFVGVTRYYDRKVTFVKDGAAVVTYCGDESKAYSKDRKTKKVTKASPSPSDYTFYSERMEKNKLGVWQSSNVISEEASKKCQP